MFIFYFSSCNSRGNFFLVFKFIQHFLSSTCIPNDFPRFRFTSPRIYTSYPFLFCWPSLFVCNLQSRQSFSRNHLHSPLSLSLSLSFPLILFLSFIDSPCLSFFLSFFLLKTIHFICIHPFMDPNILSFFLSFFENILSFFFSFFFGKHSFFLSFGNY